MLKQSNLIHLNLMFTMEQENNKLITFLDLSITRSDNGFSTSIFRKPTATDTLMHYNSCHPYEYKLAGINFLENRVTTYPMSESNQMKEIQVSQKILNETDSIISIWLIEL
jgi:hypothetical protein